ncbi:MMPL family transporter [Paenibacillaceae bacterium]|nr:MMPL family transporter [Paenibacillaceae bacterium]
MKTILKFRWVIMVLWLVAAVGLFLSAPNMENLVRDKGQISVPDGYSSVVADKLIHQMSPDTAEGSTGEPSVLVFHNSNGLTAADQAEMERAVEILKNGREAYGVQSVMTHLETKELKDQLVSEDGTTVLMLVNSSLEGRTPGEARDALYEAIADVKVEHYYTGNWLIGEDVVESSQEGLKKTEWITLIFIMVILFAVFRSAVAPFIPLLAVGFSYIVSQSVVAYLVEYANFPLSNFTQIFMVAVLFGIGTDYCILLISRFKEELAHSEDNQEAILATYRTAGRTVLFSGLAVLVGFASIGLSTFVLYRSAVAVAVGVAVLLLALATIVPFFMMLLGKKIFWPVRGSLEHKPSKLWGAMGSFSLKRPIWALLLLAVITVPFLTAYKGTISFNSLDEIGDKYDSVKGFQLISDSFGPGDSLPSTVVVKTDQPLDTSEGLAMVEQMSRELAKVEGVRSVRSATRPTGEVIEDFQVASQVDTLGSGLGEGGDGLSQISDGLSQASQSLSENGPKLEEAVSGAGELVGGTQKLQEGVTQLGDGLSQIHKGLESGTSGAGELKAGLATAKKSADLLASSAQELLKGYAAIEGGLSALGAGYSEIASGQADLVSGLSGLEQGLSGLAQKYPELQSDPDFAVIQGTATQLQQGAAGLSAGLKQLNGELSGAAAGLKQANQGFKQAADGQEQLAAGLAQLASGLGELQSGLEKASAGQGEIVGKIPEITSAFNQLIDGQKGLQSGFAELNGQLGQLTDGLNESVDGLTQVSEGLVSAQSYLTELSAAPDKQVTGWFMPDEAISSEEFQTALDVYMSENRQIAKFEVIFETNPYGKETMDQVAELQTAAGRALQGTSYAKAEYAVGGVSSMNHDLSTISAGDYSRTVMLMIVGIGLILILLFRSIVMPIYLILSLLLTFYTSLAITEVLFVNILGYSGISWAVPFFGFVLLVALGIDYSIFLMDRFKEYRHLPPREGILMAMKNMGTVIISAAVILGGTFAAMLPSGVLSLLQIATVVLCGLFLYALVMLPLFIPVMVRIFGEANWWPFMKSDKETPSYTPQKSGVKIRREQQAYTSSVNKHINKGN